MIPLIRPLQFEHAKFLQYFRRSVVANQLTNYGPLYWLAKQRLEDVLGGNVVLVKDGTAAIKVALQATLERGSRVAMPDFTHIGTLNAVLAAGMVPLILPSDPAQFTISNEALAQHHKDYDAIIVVSPFGYEVNFNAYDNFAETNHKKLIYDLAGGFGLHPKTTYPVCYSFHATKNLGIGEGGCVVFVNSERAEVARTYTNFCINKEGQIFSEFGFNHKMDEIHCAVLLALLDDVEKVYERIEKKKELIDFYQRELVQFTPIKSHSRHLRGAPSLAVVRGMEGLAKKDVVKKLAEKGITSKFYYPLMSDNKLFEDLRFKGKSDASFRSFLALPSDVTQLEAQEVLQSLYDIALK